MKNSLRIGLFSLFIFCLSAQVQAGGEKKNKAQLKKALNQAEERSFMDQHQLKKNVENQNDRRLNAYQYEDFEFQVDNKINKKKRYKGSSLKEVQLDEPDYRYEEVGEDYSGLNGLHSPVFEESEFEDIDQELQDLREISSYKWFSLKMCGASHMSPLLAMGALAKLHGIFFAWKGMFSFCVFFKT